MMENDVDKIFKQGLVNCVEPTLESDWQAFEKSLKSSPFYKSGWFLGMLALLIVAVAGFSAFNILHNEEPIYTSRTGKENIALSQKRTESGNESIASEKINEDRNSVSENNEFNENAARNNIYPDDSNSAETANAEDQEGIETNGVRKSMSQTPTDKRIAGKSGLTATTASSSSAFANEKRNEEGNSESSTQDSDFTSGGKSTIDQNASINNMDLATGVDEKPSASGTAEISDQLEAAQSNTSQSKSSQSKTPERTQNKNQTGVADVAGDFEMIPLQNPTAIFPLGANVSRDAPDFEIMMNIKKIDHPKLNTFGYALFFSLEQNTILKTSPSFGFVVRKHFSKWSVEAGIAFQQSGKLGWTQ